jgi:hypothetical protein
MSGSGDAEDLAALVDERMGRYRELWDSASSKLSAGEYEPADLVEDWFRWVGLVAQDATTAVTVALRAGSDLAARRQGGSDEG